MPEQGAVVSKGYKGAALVRNVKMENAARVPVELLFTGFFAEARASLHLADALPKGMGPGLANPSGALNRLRFAP